MGWQHGDTLLALLFSIATKYFKKYGREWEMVCSIYNKWCAVATINGVQ